MTAPPRGTIKGTAFREFVVWAERSLGPSAVIAAAEGLPPALAAELDPRRPALGLLASSRYPARLVHALIDALTRGLSDAAVDRLVHEAALATIKGMMRGVQKAAFQLLVSPERYPRIINTLWRLTYDTGTVTVTSTGPNEHVGVVRGWEAHHPLICRMNHAAKVPLYEAMGCRDVVCEQLDCVSRGGPDCRSRVAWS